MNSTPDEAKTTAEKLFDASFIESVCEDHIIEAMQAAGMSDGWHDMWWDYYDNSLEIGRCDPSFQLPAAAVEAVWALGFSTLFVNFTNDTNTVYGKGRETHTYAHNTSKTSHYLDRRSKLAHIESLRAALDQARSCIKLLIARKPVRDVTETLCAIDAALAAEKG